uniref:nucleoporin p54 isoform X2 n=1 Tax=Myxine glutinosa TaxID=7769 RepID=UPI00358F6386
MAAPFQLGVSGTGAPAASGLSFGSFGSTNPSQGFTFGSQPTGFTGFGNFGSMGFGTTAATSTLTGFGTTTSTLGGATGFGAPAAAFGGFGTGAAPSVLGIQSGTGIPGSASNTGFGAVAGGTAVLPYLSALSPCILGDDRDATLARWNQLQMAWGCGRVFCSPTTAPFALNQSNPYCRFKAVGYSRVPTRQDADGLVGLVLARDEASVRAALPSALELLQRALGGSVTVSAETLRPLPDEQTELLIYATDNRPGTGGLGRRVLASDLTAALDAPGLRSQLTQTLSVSNVTARSELSVTQRAQLIEMPPAGIVPIIWEQAKADNPDPERLLPIPMVGFSELARRLKLQEQQGTLHTARLDLIAEDISQLKGLQAASTAKLAQFKRRHSELGHRLLQVLCKQEVSRHAGLVRKEEEDLRVRLEAIAAELNTPTLYRGRLSELMSQLRVQSHTAPGPEEHYSLDPRLLVEIKQHLAEQQNGVACLVELVKEDLEDLRLMSSSLQDMGIQG